MDSICSQGRVAPIAISPLDSARGRGFKRHKSASREAFLAALILIKEANTAAGNNTRPK